MLMSSHVQQQQQQQHQTGPINVDRIDQVVAMHAEMEGKTAEDMRAEWEGVPMQRYAYLSRTVCRLLYCLRRHAIVYWVAYACQRSHE